MKKTITLLGLLLLSALIQPVFAAKALPEFPGILSIPVDPDPHWADEFKQHQPVKVVFGISDPGAQLKESLTNAALIIRDMQANGIKYKIQIVLYGNAVKTANAFDQSQSSYSGLMDALHDQGVEFKVCYNSLYSLHIDPSDLYPYMQVVPAGILQLVKAQMQGYHYISNK